MNYITDPEGEYVIDRRLTIADLSPADRADVHAEQRRNARAARFARFAVACTTGAAIANWIVR